MCNEDRWVRWNQRDSFVKLVSEACTRWSFSLKHYDDNSIRRASLEARKGDAKRKNGKRGIGYLWNDEPVKCGIVKMENPLKWESVKKIAYQKDYKGFPLWKRFNSFLLLKILHLKGFCFERFPVRCSPFLIQNFPIQAKGGATSKSSKSLENWFNNTLVWKQTKLRRRRVQK